MADVKRWSGVGLVVLSLAALTAGAAELQTAGEVLVDLDASTLEGYSEGGIVMSWPNAGTLQPAFVRTDTTKGPTYQIRDGAPAVRFAGSSSGSLTNNVPLPDSLNGNSAWTVEGWVAPTESKTDFRYFLSTPYYRGGSDTAYRRWAFRLDQKTDLYAVEHNSYQLYWGRHDPDNAIYRPEVGKWSYVCVVHEASGYERVYVNGRVASVGNTPLDLSNEDPSYFIISGIFRDNGTGWERQCYADIGRVRVQTGALTAAQVISNYNAEKEHYGATDEPDALWTDGGTWYDGRALALDGNLIIEGDQPLVIDNGASNAVHFITVNATKDTGLTIDNGSVVTVALGNNLVELGNVAGGTFTLAVPNGEFTTPANSITLGLYNHGVGVVGGRDDAFGIVNCGSSLRVGHYSGGSGEFTIKTNGIVNLTSALRIADGGSLEGHVTVEQGGELNVQGVTYVCSGTGTGVLDVYGTFTSGTPDTSPNIYLTANSASGSGTLNLHPGSVLNNSILRVDGGVTTTTGTVNIDDATIRIQNQRSALVEPPVVFNVKNGMTVDVPSGLTSTIKTTINDLTEGGAAEIVKVGGGILYLTPNDGQAPSDISSTFIVREGQLTIGNANAFAVGSSATFKLEGGAVSADYSGGAAALLARLDKESVGSFILHGNNAAENLDFSEYPGVEIVSKGAFTYTGTIKPYQNKYVFRPDGGLFVYNGDIMDNGALIASVEIYGETDLDGVTLAGANDGMSGNISVFKGILGIAVTPDAAGGPSTKLYLAEGTSLKLDARVGKTFLSTRIDPASKPAAILLTDKSAACDVDLSMFPGCRVGTDVQSTEPLVQTGTLLPNSDNVFLLGGGAIPYFQTGYRGYQPPQMTDVGDVVTRVEVGLSGIVNLSNMANSYSGGTKIVDAGVAFVSADGFGKVPEEFDEDNIYINNGVIRSGPDQTNFALAATRGVMVGPEGAELHPWGTSSLEIAGGLTGAGPIKVTDGGAIVLSGAYNTFQGPVDISNTATTLTIGSDANFSWASTDGISSVGKVVLRTTDDDVFGDVVSGTGGLTKQGEGRLTLARSQTYSGGTSVEGGTLVIPHGVTLANTASFRNNGEVVFDSLDALGTGSISGDGRFTLSGSIDLDASRIAGNPCFEVLPDAALAVNAPSFGSRSEVRLDDGSTATLGGGFVDTVEGFMGFVTSGTAKTVDGELVLTPNESGKAGSAFYTRRVKVTEPWSVSFTYQAGEHGDWTEDVLGAAFILQNADEGPALLETTAASAGCNVAKSFGALIRLGIDADCNDRWGFINGGRVEDANSAKTLAIAASAGHELVVEVTYDGTKLHTKFTCNGNSRERDWTMDPAALLGSGFAWVGFTGATSASTGCAQTIRNFRFTGGSAVTLSINETDWAHSKYAPTYTTVDGQPAFQLTTNESSKRSATWHKTRINVSRPFTASFKYRVPAHSESAADGFSIAIQNYGANAGDCYGADGGSMGIVYGTPRANTVGWGVNLYQTQSFKFVLDGTWNGDPVPMTEWDMADGNDTEFTLTYDLKTLTLTATRSGFDATVSREVDLLDKTGGAGTAWIGFTGGTGGSSAEQLVYDFTFAYGAVDNSRYANPFVVDGAVTLNLGQGAIGFADLTLLDGTVLSATSSYSGAALELGGTKLVGNATVSCVETSPIMLQDTIYFTENAGVLKLVGDVRANGKVKLDISSIKGVRNLLDLSEATTAITTDDFEVTGAVRPPVRLDIQNGILRAWRDVSTVLIFR